MDAPGRAELTPISQLPLPEKIIGEGWTILYSLGSYAPAHRNHMELLVLARQLCEQRGLRVAAILLAPTADNTLREKLGYLPLTLEARYLCLRLLIANTPGLAGIPVLIDRFLAEGKAKGAGAAAAHLEAEVKERYRGRVYVRGVFGLDALTKIRSRHAIENGIIVLNRKSSEVGNDPDEFVARHPHALIIKYIASPNWKEAVLSSTKLRSMYTLGQDISGETHPDFVKYLKANNVVLSPSASSSGAAAPFQDLVAIIYQPRTASNVKLPLAAGWSDKVRSVPFHELSPGDGVLNQGRQAQTSIMKHAGVRVAVKRSATVRQSDLKIIAREMYFLSLLKPHPHVVNLLGAGTSPEGFLYMVLQLAAGSASAELQANPPYMAHEPQSPLSIGWIRMLHYVALGMTHTHACGLLHRDLSTDNILLSGNPSDPACVAMVADFGVAKEMRDAGPVVRGACRKYSPEALGTNEKPDGKEQQAQDYIYIPASDVFMFACLAYEILCGRVYFSERTTGGACAGTLAGERPVLPACAELKMLTELITACWAQEAANRPTFAAIAPRLKTLLDNLVALKGSPAV
eukprot:Mycagemm_TRINITY_DN9896_c0_g1::TRINITY_DN9896_c0_g1_i1::g.170::m.170 type:complete len:575 gc:universal TRINITY_DN9896_c0_g1_i1:1726-2(-)